MYCQDWLARRASLTPHKPALITADGREITYERLNAEAGQLASSLAGRGMGKGERVAVLAQNGPEYLELFFAVQKLGLVLVPLNYRLSVKELEFILRDSGSSLLLYDESQEATAANLNRSCPSLPIKRAFAFNTSGQDKGAVVDGEDIWVILYTGGTTGFPKGARLSYRMITWNAFNTVVSWGLGHSDRAPVYTPFFHTGGLNVLTTPLIMAGGTTILPGPFQAGQALEIISRYKPTVVFMVPTMYKMLLEQSLFDKTDFGSVRFCIAGGAPCPVDVSEAFARRGILFRQGYGLTEGGPNCFWLPDEYAAGKPGAVGRPVFFNEVRLVDQEAQPVRPGQVGELTMRGPHLFSGYWRNEKATHDALVDGWLFTGDLAACDEDGHYHIVDRKKDVIISGGENIYPAEIEAVLSVHPAVAEAAVVGVPDELWGEVPKAVLVLKDGFQISAEEVVSFCAVRLGRYKKPKTVEFRPALPKSATGKILKRELK